MATEILKLTAQIVMSHASMSEISPQQLVEEIKKSSSQKMKANGITNFYWQRGYGSFSVSQSEVETVTRYIKRQKERHRKMSFQEEYKIFLKKHQLDYDQKFVWD